MFQKLICFFRGHKFGTWYNKKEMTYYGIHCSRCGLWYGDYKGPRLNG